MSLNFTPLDAVVYLFCKTQIAGLIAKKSPTKVSAEYTDFADVFFPDLAFELPKHIEINDHVIKLVDSQQLSYGLIYSLKLVELKILKVYIKTNLANSFIRQSKSFLDALIFFDKKLDRFFWLYVDYKGPNKLTIKNWYPLLLVKNLLNRLGRARQFTQLDFTNTYY